MEYDQTTRKFITTPKEDELLGSSNHDIGGAGPMIDYIELRLAFLDQGFKTLVKIYDNELADSFRIEYLENKELFTGMLDVAERAIDECVSEFSNEIDNFFLQ